MRFDPEIEESAMEAARQAGREKDPSYWRELYLRELERTQKREREWELNRTILWIAGVGAFLVFFVKGVLHW
jgi:hypothetical protein